jgi:hypothetical protein
MMMSELVGEIRTTLADPRIAERIEEIRANNTRGIEDVWFLYTIAHGSEGVHQWKDACDFFDLDVPKDEPEWVWDDIEEKASEMSDDLNKMLEDIILDGCFVYVGHWDGGGCYGIILAYDYSDDDRNFHTKRQPEENSAAKVRDALVSTGVNDDQ